MKRWALLFVLLLCLGCGQPIGAGDDRDATAIDLALATLAVDVQPPAPSPETLDVGGTLYGGPIDLYRDARALVDKGNSLADRGKQLLDAAEREGKITLDVHLPKPAGPSPQPRAPSAQPAAHQPLSTDNCTGGVCRPALLPRWRLRR